MKSGGSMDGLKTRARKRCAPALFGYSAATIEPLIHAALGFMCQAFSPTAYSPVRLARSWSTRPIFVAGAFVTVTRLRHFA